MQVYALQCALIAVYKKHEPPSIHVYPTVSYEMLHFDAFLSQTRTAKNNFKPVMCSHSLRTETDPQSVGFLPKSTLGKSLLAAGK